MRGRRAEHLRRPLLVGVDRGGDERRLRADRDRQRVEGWSTEPSGVDFVIFPRSEVGEYWPFVNPTIRLLNRRIVMSTFVAARGSDGLPPMDSASPSPVTTHTERSVVEVARPVAIAGARPWIECMPLRCHVVRKARQAPADARDEDEVVAPGTPSWARKTGRRRGSRSPQPSTQRASWSDLKSFVVSCTDPVAAGHRSFPLR